jgi:hypothetical protein
VVGRWRVRSARRTPAPRPGDRAWCPVNRLLRACGLVLVAVAAVGSAGCFKSENVGKLEGTKWSSAYVPDFKGISGRGLTMSIQFTDGGRFNMEMRSPLISLRCSGTWRLGSGETVYLDDVAPAVGGYTSFTESITITGDTMTMTDPDGTKIIFTKIDPEMEKANKGGSTTSPTSRKSGSDTPAKPTGPTETVTKNGKTVTKTYGP